jgi:hypothetical protein
MSINPAVLWNYSWANPTPQTIIFWIKLVLQLL